MWVFPVNLPNFLSGIEEREHHPTCLLNLKEVLFTFVPFLYKGDTVFGE